MKEVLGSVSMLLLATAVLAQEATLDFTVIDATSGSPLPGVTVELSGKTSAEELITGPGGRVRFVDLETGYYAIRASMAGFQSATQAADVSAGANQGVIQLEPFRLVSMIRLLSNPEEYDGLPVGVDGFCSLGSENDVLYLHREDWVYGLRRNALWLDANAKDVAMRFNKKHVTVFGTFVANPLGGLYGGGITSIEKVNSLDRR